MGLNRSSRQASALLAAASEGDGAGWAGLVDLYGELVWTVAARPDLSRAAAEHVSHVTWLRLAQRLGQQPQDFAVGVWLAGTAREEAHRCLGLQRWAAPETGLLTGSDARR